MKINRIYILKTITKSAWSNFPIEVIDGRLPQNENEIAISEAIDKQCKGRLQNWGSTHS